VTAPRVALPIDPLLPSIVDEVRRRRALVLEAPPGAGKTTRVPGALLDGGIAADGEILVLEPRRLPARMAARRVAEERGEAVGETVGYTMRFEEASSARTRLRFVTEGILTRRLLSDPELRGVGAVVLDEFHERHLAADVGLASLRRLQRGPRPDLALVVMSATLESAPVAAFLDAPILRSEGRLFEVAIEHLERSDDRPLESQVASAVRRLVDEGLDGDVLVFLPGALEIRRATEACRPLAERADLLVVPLHGSLTPAEQDRAVGPASQRKVILSTNVAESSVTIDGVVAVIDAGLARVAAYAPWSGLPTLRVAKVSRASATQRAGRAGRTRPGRCLRLYTKGDFLARPEHDAPEVARADLAETALELVASGASDLGAFGWFEAPPAAALTAATALLERLGAVARGRAGGLEVTSTGRRILRFPVHPRLGRLLVEAEHRGVAAEGAAVAALLGERELGASRGPRARAETGSSDVEVLLATLDECERAGFAPHRLRAMGIDATRALAVRRVEKQLARLVDRRAARAPATPPEREKALAVSVLAGYPDRVGRLRRPDNATGRAAREVVFASGGTAVLSEQSVVAEVDLVVAVDVEERTDGRQSRTLVRVASAVEADDLLDLFTDAIKDTTEVALVGSSGRVEVVRRLSYDGLVLEESRGPTSDPELVARALADAALAKGVRTFAKGDELDRLRARLAFLAGACPELELPAIDDAALERELVALCRGRRSLAELEDADFAGAVRARLAPAQQRALAEHAPDSVTLPGGRRARVDYPPDGPPCVASRLQDFFGMAEGPRVANGRVPLVLHLLAPNQRAVQVTTDLAGFWARHYPAIAKELRRRYPRHAWPDDPLHATPPTPGPRRR
jgi:ATP-dependent helicase HrpB